MHQYIDQNKDIANADVEPFLERLNDLRSDLKAGKEMDPEKFRATINDFVSSFNDEVDAHVKDGELND